VIRSIGILQGAAAQALGFDNAKRTANDAINLYEDEISELRDEIARLQMALELKPSDEDLIALARGLSNIGNLNGDDWSAYSAASKSLQDSYLPVITIETAGGEE